ncbi:MAG: folylpolyglutamate synthase/dihydrofolate synthase family protein [Pseudomonadota bacterium]
MSMAAFATPRQRVDDALSRMQALHPQLIDLGLPRILRFLDVLGRPQDKVPPVVHVAGTNGKGSTLAFMRAILEASGAQVHAFTSPHLVRFNERIRLAGALIEDGLLADFLDRCEAANQGQDITYFEITTAAAFLAFAETPADYLLLETGLGGRLDATNVVDKPLATVITPISHDHQRFLGQTIGRIAWEKAGIIKPDTPVVIAPQEFTDATDVLLGRADELGVNALCHGRDWQVAESAEGFALSLKGQERRFPAPNLNGRHQIDNAATAIVTLETALGAPLDQTVIERGLASAAWPARLQELTSLESAQRLPEGWSLWLDGGHNSGAARALSAWSADRQKPLHLIVGILQRKDERGFLDPFAGQAASMTAIPVPSDTPSVDPADLVQTAKAVGLTNTDTAQDVHQAVGAIIERGGEPGDIVICGSLYLAGAVLGEAGTA